MRFPFLTPQVFDTLIYLVIAVGLVFAVRRLAQDLRRKPDQDTDRPSKPDDKPS